MIVEFPYGKKDLKIDIPNGNLEEVLEKEKKEGLKEEKDAVLNSLKNPIGTQPLRKQVEKDDEVAIVVDDNTRPCPDEKLLPPILNELEGGGVKKDNIKIVIAYGLHPSLSEEKLKNLLGQEIIENYNIINHESKDTIRLGKSSRKIPIEVNKEIVNADFLISTGLIEPHFFAGFSGGRKSIMPGVSSRRAIYGNHGFKMIDHPSSKPGRLKNNPIYQDSEEHAEKANLDFILNVLLNRKKKIIEVVAGDPTEAFLRGVKHEKKRSMQKINQKADIVVTTNSGTPLDLDLYQTVKGMYHASLAAKEGGTIIIASECEEGVGPDEFIELHQSAETPEEILKIIQKEEPIGVQWQNQILAQVQKRNDIFLKSSLKDRTVESVGVNPIDKIEAGLEIAFDKIGEDAKVIAIPEGPMLVPTS